MKRTGLVFVAVLTGAGACTPGEAPPVAAPTTVAIAAAPRDDLPPPPPPPPAQVARKLAGPALDAVRDERRSRAPRAHQLVVTELQGLEAMFVATPPGSPDRPALMRRLAEDYAELEASAAADSKLGAAAHVAAMKYDTLLEREYPRWCRANDPVDPAKSSGCVDEVLYHHGLDAERAREFDVARKSYLQLIQSWPQSRLIPNAYLAFGEMFLNDAKDDPSKLPLAEQSYHEVLKYPPPGNRVYGYAAYRLAEVYARGGDDARALAELLKATQYARTFQDGTGLAAAARRSAIPVYSRVGDPAKASVFFERLGASPAELDELPAALARPHRWP